MRDNGPAIQEITTAAYVIPTDAPEASTIVVASQARVPSASGASVGIT
jgi:hypothetical protein